MEVLVEDKKIILQKKDRKIGSEAPAIKLKMLDENSKVIGMMADKVQVIITINDPADIVDLLTTIIKKYNNQANIYIISSSKIQIDLDSSMLSTDFQNLSLKLGVNINESLMAKSIFIIDKEGEFVYKEILPDLTSDFDHEKFDTTLSEAIHFKKKGHTHENWMGV